MKKIILFCGAGMSSSMLMMQMRKVAEENQLPCTIDAYSLYYAYERKVEGDCILIGPQVRTALSRIQSIYPDTPCEVINAQAYGMMDGRKVLAQAIHMMKKQQNR